MKSLHNDESLLKFFQIVSVSKLGGDSSEKLLFFLDENMNYKVGDTYTSYTLNRA